MKASHRATLKTPSFIFGFLFFAACMTGFAFFVHHVQTWLADEQRAPLKRILIAGERHYINDTHIRDTIFEHHQGSFFELDVEDAHQVIEDLPWVYRASLRKEWPNTLKIYVVEQKPVARWNGDLLINQYGDTFQAMLTEQLLSLPQLFGPSGSEVTALEGYRAMQSLLSFSDLAIEELLLSERFAWDVKLSNEIQLRLGRSEFINRLQRFVDLYPILQTKPVDYVDLRYDTGLAVGWKNAHQQKTEGGV